MRQGVVAHDYYVDDKTVDELRGMNFVFLCLDKSSAKRIIVEKLEALDIPFIDVGMGIELVDGQLGGVIRVTTSTQQMRSHVREKHRIPLTDPQEDGGAAYAQNIKIADLNALNAALAVVKWKKLFGFYRDIDKEHFSTFTIDGNALVNEDNA
jgi:hypothetical protein